jgi:hypothetical protein
MMHHRVSDPGVRAGAVSDNGQFCCPEPPSLILTIASLRSECVDGIHRGGSPGRCPGGH